MRTEDKSLDKIEDRNVAVLYEADKDGFFKIYSLDVVRFDIEPQFQFTNILGKWSKMCVAYDFDKNVGQAAFNGKTSNVVKDPKTRPNYNGTFDKTLIKNADAGSKMVLILGRYAFNLNPFIGNMANVNVWDKMLDEAELKKQTDCLTTSSDQGSLVNASSKWELTGKLVKEVSISADEAICLKKNRIYNAFLPISQLTKDDALDLCHKFGRDVFIAGDFESIEDFDNFYDGLYSDEKYVDVCSFYDSGRLRTWLPYKHNEERTELVHEVTKIPLMNNTQTLYTSWYSGPQQYSGVPDLCGEAYFGIVPRYQNIREDPCSAKKCTACEVQNSFLKTSTLKLNGLCKLSYFDKIYQVKYDNENVITYVGIEKSVISYDFDRKTWRIMDMTNPDVVAESRAPFRSLAIGNYEWKITNDTECSQDDYTTVLSLTSCSREEFTCDNGLCIR